MHRASLICQVVQLARNEGSKFMRPIKNNNWKKSLVSPKNTISELIINLNNSGLRIAIVVDADNKLLGVVTDGDIRKAILDCIPFDLPLEAIMNKNPIHICVEKNPVDVLKKIQEFKVVKLPIVDAGNKVVGLYELDHLNVSWHNNIIVIMAGGEGLRMRPLTAAYPKPMLPVGGKPILERIIEEFREQGYHRYIISINYLGDVIQDYFGNGESLGVEISYINEKEKLGTAGSISLIDLEINAPFIVINGDVLTSINLTDLLHFHNFHDSSATMVVSQHEWRSEFGVVKLDGVDIVGFEEKPVFRHYINAGIYILDPLAIGLLGRNTKCDMPQLFDSIKLAGYRIAAYPIHEKWIDVGRPEDFDDANRRYQ